MLERVKRFSTLKGLPATTKFANPETFYNDLQQCSNDLCVWKGELYFELHRGTYTSHGLVKKLNRKCEYLLRNVEMLWSMVLGYKFGDSYPMEELDRLWKLLLLNQFHDVLPGSSIQMVYVDAIKGFEDIVITGQVLVEKALEHLTQEGDGCYFNPTSWTRKAKLIQVERFGNDYLQISNDDFGLVFVEEMPPMSFFTIKATLPIHPVTVKGIIQLIEIITSTQSGTDDFEVVEVQSQFIIENGLLKITFDHHGRIISLYDNEQK
jgi:alpha-mannosidase